MLFKEYEPMYAIWYSSQMKSVTSMLLDILASSPSFVDSNDVQACLNIGYLQAR